MSALKHLTADGLMVLPPFFYDATQTAPYFRKLRELRDALNREDLGGFHLSHLSMGMTNDYPEAIAAGATFIRIGTAVFGERDYNHP